MPTRDDRAEPRVAAYLGRLLPIKGLDMLIEAWSVVRPEGWVLRLAGPCDDAMAADLRARITTHGLADAIRLEPPISRDEVEDFLARADLFILPSRSENFGLVAGEALAVGVPVVATTETAWTELAAMGCGWCVPADTPSLAHALRTATATPEPALHDMGRRGAAWIKRDFAWSTIAARLVRDAYTTG
jgi:glycosyltransferase involved in cell wall biosynthesis